MTPDSGGTGSAVFAALLYDARRSAGLTQAELAAKAGVGVRTVRDLERGRAARPQRTTAELLAAALGLEGNSHSRFMAAARGSGGGPPPVGRLSGQPSTVALPRAPELIGRDRELAAVADLLGAPGVVTLVGLAGVGKSSLLIAVAHRVAHRFPGGVAGIAVTQDAIDDNILSSIATVFGANRVADLAERLAVPALLLVDSVELSDGTARAVAWLRRIAPELRVLAAGRRRLGGPDEQAYPVEPLEVPPELPGLDLATVAGYPAAALFLARLAEVRREPVAEAEVPALVALVRRLGGLPLALELAAARGRVLDAGELLQRYGDRLLDLHGAGEDLGLRAAITGSYGLLDPAAQFALRRLAAFRGRWSVELAEDLLADGEVWAVLDRLVGLGLVTVRGTGQFRFLLLDVVRELALEEARARGELGDALRRHAVVMARLAARTAGELVGSTMTSAVNRLDNVAADLWAALAHAAEDDPPTALCLASKLPRWWRFRGRDVPGRQWLRRLLDDPRTKGAHPRVRAWAHLGVAQLAQEHGAGQAELPAAEQALAAFQALGSVTGELAARNLLCSLWMAGGGYDQAREHGQAALALASRSGRVRDVAVAQNNLTWHEIRVGDLAAARRRLAAVDRLAAYCGELRLRVLARANLAEVARIDGRYDEAVTVARAAVPLMEELGDPGHRRRVLGIIGLAHAQSGRLTEATRVLAELRTEQDPAEQDPAEQDPADGVQPAIEGWIALHRGARDLAAEWFTAAASASAGRYDVRDLVEALVGLAASCPDADLPAVRARLTEVCRRSGITLLPRERALLDLRDAGAGPDRDATARAAPPIPPG